MTRLLVVEDDRTIGALLQTSLQRHGYRAVWATGGRAAIEAADVEPFDLVLLDLGLPDIDGVEVCRQLRRLQPGCVLVMLTARQEEMDVVVGLEAGADDYLTKPFRLEELLARVRAHVRRGGSIGTGSTYTGGPLRVDAAARRCTLGGAEVELRAKEFDLLARLASEAGTAVSRETLMAEVWDANWFGSTKTLDVHVAALRRRLADAATVGGTEVPTISTLRGFGYRLEVS